MEEEDPLQSGHSSWKSERISVKPSVEQSQLKTLREEFEIGGKKSEKLVA
jgi:hypothetical protein